MNIDSKLTSFQSSVGANLSSVKNAKTNLSNDINNFKSINDSVSSSLTQVFKGEGGDAITPEVEFLNQTIIKVQNSLESELSSVITKCENLNNGIEELKIILTEYNNIQTEYSGMDDDNKNKTSLSSKLSTLKNNFETKQASLLKEHEALLNEDESLTILSEFGKEDASLSEGFTAIYDGAQFSSIYYYKDGVVYQKIVPICVNGKSVALNDVYTIIYNTDNILKVAGDTEYTQALFSYLNGKLDNSNTDRYLWDYSTTNYKAATSETIAKIMNQILKDTYQANNASTISDYAALAAMVANNSVVHFGYGGNQGECDYGYESVLKNGGDLDCIGFVRWCYSQGLYNTGTVQEGYSAKDYIKQGSSMTPFNLLEHHSLDISEMSMAERASIPIGSVLSRPCYDSAGNINNYHVGIVIGHTIDENGEPAIVVAQSSNTTVGANNSVYPLVELASAKNKWTNVSTPEMMTIRVTQGSYKGSTWLA